MTMKKLLIGLPIVSIGESEAMIQPKEFKINSIYSHRWVNDSQLTTSYKVVKLTKSFVTLIESGELKPIRCKIFKDDDTQFCFPSGRYSMAPVLKASNEASGSTPFLIPLID